MITFFDIPSTLPSNSWSPNTWRTRLCLNYKGLEYRTEWVEYPDIEAVCEEQGIEPTAKRKDGSPYYTLPAIVDETKFGKRVAVSESFEIAKYLDEAYPDTKRLLPEEGKEAEERQREFPIEFRKMVFIPLAAIILPRVHDILNPASQPHFSHSRASMIFEKESLEEVVVSAEERERLWEEFRKGLARLDEEYYAKTDDKGPWFLGDTISFADFVVVAFLIAVNRAFGDNSWEWMEIRKWNGGRWAKLFDEAENPKRL